MAWHTRGWDWVKDRVRRNELLIGFPKILWLKKGEAKKLLFIDDSPFMVAIHLKKTVDGNMRPFVCLNSGKHLGIDGAEEKECYLCKDGRSVRIVGAMTVLDGTGYTKKVNGKEDVTYAYLRRMALFSADDELPALHEAMRGAGLEGLEGVIVEALQPVDAKGDLYMSPGKEFKFLSHVPREKWEGVAKDRNADVQRNPWEPFSFEKCLKMMDNELIKALVVGGKKIEDKTADEEVAY